MIRIITLLCLTAPVFSWWNTKLEAGLKIRYDVNPISMVFGKSFIDLPRSIDSANETGWEQTLNPNLHAEYSSLELWCPNPKCSEICVLFDDTGYPAGILISFNMKQYTNALYSLTTQGFKKWNRIDKNGKSQELMSTVVYFQSPEYLKKSPEDRIAARNSETLLQDECIYVSGINGELHRISTNVTEIADTATSNFTLQACMPWMVWWPRTELSTAQKDLEKLQRLACVAITSSMRTTPTAALQAMLGLPPLHLIVQEEAASAAFRLSVSSNHYYYLMTKDLECNDQLFPFFPLEFNGKLVGLGFVGYGTYKTDPDCTECFERPSHAAIKIIVPRGPDCLYKLADNPGVITSHMYFINNPTSMLCLPW